MGRKGSWALFIASGEEDRHPVADSVIRNMKAPGETRKQESTTEGK